MHPARNLPAYSPYLQPQHPQYPPHNQHPHHNQHVAHSHQPQSQPGQQPGQQPHHSHHQVQAHHLPQLQHVSGPIPSLSQQAPWQGQSVSAHHHHHLPPPGAHYAGGHMMHKPAGAPLGPVSTLASPSSISSVSSGGSTASTTPTSAGTNPPGSLSKDGMASEHSIKHENGEPQLPSADSLGGVPGGSLGSMSGMPGSMAEPYEPYTYSLRVVQQPVRARMCGFGDKDRRPITPPPCIQLIIRDKATGNEADISKLDVSFYATTVELWSADEQLNQNLVRTLNGPAGLSASSSSVPAGSRSGDYYNDTHQSGIGSSQLVPSSAIPTPLHQLSTPNSPPPTKNLIGSVVATAFKLYDPAGKLGVWFILQDLSVRTEGEFKLKFSFVNLGLGPAMMPPDMHSQHSQQPTKLSPSSQQLPHMQQLPLQMSPSHYGGPGVGSQKHSPGSHAQSHNGTQPIKTQSPPHGHNHHGGQTSPSLSHMTHQQSPTYRPQDMVVINQGTAKIQATCFSNKFKVYSAKKFPGVIESTDLSRCFVGQGIKIPIRKEQKPNKNDQGGSMTDSNQPSPSQSQPQTPVSKPSGQSSAPSSAGQPATAYPIGQMGGYEH
ncbi:velvet factor-domain-containing protein [Dipodascopsis tothii]|uniref:velvet factor-domain-containing protein n=1 Tax=Dipodascopsis tothii TaxID=44089 RepID=UPI0034CD8C43